MTDRNLIAIDLAKSVFQVCVFSRSGKVVSNRRHRRAELKTFMATGFLGAAIIGGVIALTFGWLASKLTEELFP